MNARMPTTFDDLPENVLHLMLGGFTPSEWREIRFVNRRFNSVALVRHHSAVRSIKFNLVVKDQGFYRDSNDDYQTCNVYAWVPMDANDKQSEVRALMAFTRKKLLTFDEFRQMVGRFCPHLNHVQIIPYYVYGIDHSVASPAADSLIRLEQQVCVYMPDLSLIRSIFKIKLSKFTIRLSFSIWF